jgi:hypothetical protein
MIPRLPVHRTPAPALRGIRNMRGLGGYGRQLGDTTPDRSQYDTAGNLLQQANANLKALESAYAQTPSTYSAATGSELISLRSRYSQILSAYIQVYGTAFGPPNTAGLEGLGQWQLYVGAALGIAGIIAAIYEWNKIENNTAAQMQAEVAQAQANQAQQANVAAAQTNLAQAIAAGDTAAAAQWTAALQANPVYQDPNAPAPTSTLITFLSTYGVYIAVGIGALLVAKEL